MWFFYVPQPSREIFKTYQKSNWHAHHYWVFFSHHYCSYNKTYSSSSYLQEIKFSLCPSKSYFPVSQFRKKRGFHLLDKLKVLPPRQALFWAYKSKKSNMSSIPIYKIKSLLRLLVSSHFPLFPILSHRSQNFLSSSGLSLERGAKFFHSIPFFLKATVTTYLFW